MTEATSSAAVISQAPNLEVAAAAIPWRQPVVPAHLGDLELGSDAWQQRMDAWSVAHAERTRYEPVTNAFERLAPRTGASASLSQIAAAAAVPTAKVHAWSKTAYGIKVVRDGSGIRCLRTERSVFDTSSYRDRRYPQGFNPLAYPLVEHEFDWNGEFQGKPPTRVIHRGIAMLPALHQEQDPRDPDTVYQVVCLDGAYRIATRTKDSWSHGAPRTVDTQVIRMTDPAYASPRAAIGCCRAACARLQRATRLETASEAQSRRFRAEAADVRRVFEAWAGATKPLTPRHRAVPHACSVGRRSSIILTGMAVQTVLHAWPVVDGREDQVVCHQGAFRLAEGAVTTDPDIHDNSGRVPPIPIQAIDTRASRAWPTLEAATAGIDALRCRAQRMAARSAACRARRAAFAKRFQLLTLGARTDRSTDHLVVKHLRPREEDASWWTVTGPILDVATYAKQVTASDASDRGYEHMVPHLVRLRSCGRDQASATFRRSHYRGD